MSNQTDVASWLFELIHDYSGRDLVVVVEDFVGAGRRDANIIATIELLGYVILTCKLFGIPLSVQVPQFRKPFVPDAIQRFRTHEDRHMCAAYAHVLGYLVQTQKGGDLFATGTAIGARAIDRKLSETARRAHT